MAGGNVTDHLANERTFLAWVRTSIALMGFGVVIARLRFTLIESGIAGQNAGPSAGLRSTLLGFLFAAIGLLTLLFALIHYQRSRRMIDSGDYRPMGGAITGFAFVIVALGVASIAYLLSLFPH
jgi:putative membrane protein